MPFAKISRNKSPDTGGRPSRRKRDVKSHFFGVENRPFLGLCCFIVAVFLLGGGARHDILSLAFLRPLAILMAAAAWLRWGAQDRIGSYRIPIVVLGILLLILLLQLIPLPPEIWRGLPGRAVIAEVEDIVGINDQWRPISLTPARTVNTLMSLTVPAAAIILMSAQKQDVFGRIVAIFVSLGATSAVLGILQLGLGPESVLYPYDIMNRNSPVGLFANRNHQAVFMACMLPMLTWLFIHAYSRPFKSYAPLVRAFCGALFVFVWIIVALAGSRAGLLMTALAMPLSVWVALSSATNSREGRSSIKSKGKKLGRNRGAFIASPKFRLSLLTASIILPFALIFLMITSGSFTANRLVSSSLDDEMRVKIFQINTDLAQFYFPWGSGFGSYDSIFYQVEPATMVGPSYVNHAHNDWIQILIEGGAPAALLALGILIWLIGRVWNFTRTPAAVQADKRLAASVLAILLAASLFDYPLRTPSMMVFGTIFILAMCHDPRRQSEAR